MPGCAVAGCLSYSRKTKGTDIVYHSFPKDLLIQKTWINRCQRKDSFNILTSTVCSNHFMPQDYIRDLHAELLKITPKKVLKPDTVPNVNLPRAVHSYTNRSASVSVHIDNSVPQSSYSNITYTLKYRTERSNSRTVKKRAIETINNLSPKKRKTDQSTSTEPSENETEEIKILKKEVKELQEKNRRLEAKCRELTVKNKYLREEISAKTRKGKLYDTNFKKLVNEEINKIMSHLFSENQVKCLLTGKRQSKWKREDICKAVTLRAISRKCYIFLRNKLGFPFPGISTLKRWISRSFPCLPGVLSDVIELMKATAEVFTSTERLCVLSFDEMNVDSSITYDQKEDCVIGPHSNVQVAMIRGLLGGWKQPIYYDFDIQMSAALMNSIICSLEDAGYNVVAVVADLGPKNRCVWNELNVSHTNTCFINPRHPNKRVWVFSDIPHLLDNGEM